MTCFFYLTGLQTIKGNPGLTALATTFSLTPPKGPAKIPEAMDFHKIWIEQCDATEGIRERFGLKDALDYLIGQKLMNFIEASDKHPEFARELPRFVERIKEIFGPDEIAGFLQQREQEQGRSEIPKDPGFEGFQEEGYEPEDVADGAREILLLERAKELLRV